MRSLLELKVEMGAGEGRLHLRDVPVTRLTLNMGAGRVMVDLTGDRKKDVDADIEGGVGEATVRLPTQHRRNGSCFGRHRWDLRSRFQEAR